VFTANIFMPVLPMQITGRFIKIFRLHIIYPRLCKQKLKFSLLVIFAFQLHSALILLASTLTKFQPAQPVEFIIVHG